MTPAQLHESFLSLPGGLQSVELEDGVRAESLVYSLFEAHDLTGRPRATRTSLVRGSRCRTSAALFDEISAVLQFPSHFGSNWDAMEEDLLWFRSPARDEVVVFDEPDQILVEAPSREASILLTILRERAGAPGARGEDDFSFTVVLAGTAVELSQLQARASAVT